MQIRNKSLLALLDKGQASIYLAFYSAETLFKQLIQIKEFSGQLQLQRGAVMGSLEIEPLIVASQKII